MRMHLIATPLLLLTSACVPVEEPVPADARGTLLTAANETRGSVEVRAAGPERLSVAISVVGAAPGRFGIHVHAVGQCEGPGFTSAGPHWNPAGRQHGRNNPAGVHHGDLPNIEIGADGAGRLSADIPGTIAGLLDADGAALILHAAADDERTDPTGNSGARVACAVLRPSTRSGGAGL
jgi:superoxide dismutase, Cu-Zn family